MSLYPPAPLAEPQRQKPGLSRPNPWRAITHSPHSHFPNPLWQWSFWIAGCVENQSDLEVPSPFFPGPRGTEEAGCSSHYQPSHVPWASWCKWLVNWRLQGCLEIGHQFLKAKLNSWNWQDLTITFQSCCIWLFPNLAFLLFFLANYWGSLFFIKPLLSLHPMAPNLGYTMESSKEL